MIIFWIAVGVCIAALIFLIAMRISYKRLPK